MKGKYLRKTASFLLATLMLSRIAFVSAEVVQAQGVMRVVVVRRNPYRIYRRFDVFGYDRWSYDRGGFDRFGRDRWGNYRYDPWSPYGSQYRQYAFRNSESALTAGYKQGLKTGRDHGKKAKSFSPQRSHYYQEAGLGNFGEVYRAEFARDYQEGYRAGSNERLG